MKQSVRLAILGTCLGAVAWATAPEPPPDEGIPFPLVGKIKPRHAREIAGSNWSVGAEKMDRDMSIYDNWKSWLGPLGVKKARIQSGWAKTEKVPGTYDFAWMDRTVSDMVAQGVEPWMCLCYGNPAYEGGGEPQVGGKVPTSEVALAAWISWVKATVTRYQGQIDEWEVWNEPNYHIAVTDYARLLILTAEAVKSVQPRATVIALALGSKVDYKYADAVLAVLQREGKLALIDQVSHHRHQRNPDERGQEIDLEKVVAKYAPHLVLRQTEGGCPSEYRERAAMSKYPWTELTQSKHILRRLLADLGHDKESSLFTIVDFSTGGGKGLLRARADHTVDYPKPAYYAVQNLTAVFDNRLVRLREFSHSGGVTGRPISLYGYRHELSGRTVITLWFKGDVPSNDNGKTAVDLAFSPASFVEPLLVDLRTGSIYAIPRDSWSVREGVTAFKQIPIYDSPILIADRSTLPIEKNTVCQNTGCNTKKPGK